MKDKNILKNFKSLCCKESIQQVGRACWICEKCKGDVSISVVLFVDSILQSKKK